MVDDFPDLRCLQKGRVCCSLSKTVYICSLTLVGQQSLSKMCKATTWVKQVWITQMLEEAGKSKQLCIKLDLASLSQIPGGEVSYRCQLPWVLVCLG